ncbi:Pyrroline-5-carboxylate reductase [subsurface metagenome]|nr:pyrroline-5-carboxylate reductase [Hadesarchaea archaeon]
MKIGVIGCGNLGSSLVKGLLETTALRAEEMIASDIREENLTKLKNLGIETTGDNQKLVKRCDAVLIAVKPDIVESVLKKTKEISDGKLFISVAAGVSTKFIEARTNARVVRVMPNICGAVGEMASCFSLGKRASREDEKLVEKLLAGMGTTFKVDEKLMDAVTGLSGSGPAYFYFIVKALQEAGVELGLSSEVALKLAAQTAKGAGETILRGEKTPEELMGMICTPKGTTIEGLKVLKNRKVADALKSAVKAAARRAKELSR